MTIKGELAAAERRRKSVRARHDRERSSMVEKHRGELAELDREIRRLRTQARAVGVLPPRIRTAAVQVGPKALGQVREAFLSGARTQAALTRDLQLNPGTVSHALRALMEAGEIKETSRKVVNGSREFRLTTRGWLRARRAA